jgi:hypothetical protein
MKRIMQLCQQSSSAQWMIVVFNAFSCITKEFLPLYLNKERGEEIVQAFYPNAWTFIWLE